MFLTILHYAAGPLIGGLIGYLTNYLAVKMLFRPYKAVKIGKWTLPFTPGIVPKRKKQLAAAIGKAVGEQLFTAEDLKKSFSAEETKEKIVDLIVDELCGKDGEKRTLGSLIDSYTGGGYEQKEEQLSAFLSQKIALAASKGNVGALIAQRASAVVKEKKASLGMLAFMLGDDMIDGMLLKVGDSINAYAEQNGAAALQPSVKAEICALGERSADELVGKETLRGAIGRCCDEFLSRAAAEILKSVDVSAVAEAKINAMDMRELEALCLSVMKKELNAVVWIGGVLGFLIGCVNIFI